MEAPRNTFRALVAVWGLAAGALAVRLRTLGTPVLDDPPYHLLRIWRLLSRDGTGMGTNGADPLVGHPWGAVPCWPWGFDALFAVVLWPFLGSSPTREEVARAAAVVVPVAGASLVPLAFALARRVSARPVAIGAAAVAGFVPFFFVYSFAGRVDHHVLEPAALAILALGSAGACATEGGTLRRVAWTALAGGIGGLSLGMFPAALPVTILVAAAMIPATVRAGLPACVSLAASLVAGTAASLAFSPHPFDWVFHSPSLLHFALIGIVAVALLGAGLGATRSERRPLFVGAMTGLVAAFLASGVLAVAFPGFLASLEDGWGYVATSQVARLSDEATPILADLDFAWVDLTGLAPFAVVGAVFLVAGRDASPARRGVGVISLAILALSLFQRRFLCPGIVFFAVALAEGCAFAWERAGGFALRRGLRRSVVILAGVALLAAGTVRSALLVVSGDPSGPRDEVVLRAATNLASAPRNPGDGALTPWSFGHVFQYYADVPTVCDNFWGTPDHDRAFLDCLRLYLATDPTEIERRLEALRVRWVVVVPPMPGEVSLYAGLLGLDPAAWRTPDGSLPREFTRTLWNRLGQFGNAAERGQAGPFGFVLRDRVTARDPETNRPVALVQVFERSERGPVP